MHDIVFNSFKERLNARSFNTLSLISDTNTIDDKGDKDVQLMDETIYDDDRIPSEEQSLINTGNY